MPILCYTLIGEFMYKIKQDEFDIAYAILEEAFPSAELRQYNLMKHFVLEYQHLIYNFV